MSPLLTRKFLFPIIAFLLLDLLAVGVGMGVPFFAFLLMLLISSPITRMLFDPLADIANFGIPLILYEPRANFISWFVFMILISPFLQALTAGIASSVRLAWFPPAPFRE